MALFVRWPSSSCNGLMSFQHCLLPLMYFKPSFYYPPHFWWLQLQWNFGHTSSPTTVVSSISVLLPYHLTLLPLGIPLPFLPYLQKKIPLQPRRPSASSAWFPLFRNCLFLCPQELVLKKWPQYWWIPGPSKAFSQVCWFSNHFTNLKISNFEEKKPSFFFLKISNSRFQKSQIDEPKPLHRETLLTGSLSSLKSLLPMSRAEVLLALFLLSPDIWNSMASWPLWPRQPPISTQGDHKILSVDKQQIKEGGHLSESAFLGPVAWSGHPGVSGIHREYMKIVLKKQNILRPAVDLMTISSPKCVPCVSRSLYCNNAFEINLLWNEKRLKHPGVLPVPNQSFCLEGKV